jgi:hypothetical protein
MVAAGSGAAANAWRQFRFSAGFAQSTRPGGTAVGAAPADAEPDAGATALGAFAEFAMTARKRRALSTKGLAG